MVFIYIRIIKKNYFYTLSPSDLFKVLVRNFELSILTFQVAAAPGNGKSWGDYKKGKGSNSKLLAMLREKHAKK